MAANISWKNAPTDAEQLEIAKEAKKKKIEKERDLALEGNFQYQASETTVLNIQSRQRDRENIVGRVSAAQIKLSQGDTSNMVFRDADNISHDLSPEEMLGLGMAAMQHQETQYAISWHLKELVDAATTIEDVQNLPDWE